MELTIFNQDTSPLPKPEEMFVRLNHSGSVTLSTALAHQLKVKKDDQVEFAFDEKEKQWYIYKSASKKAFKLRSSSPNSSSLVFNSSPIVRNVFQQTACKEKSKKCPVSQAFVEWGGYQLYPVITLKS